MAYVKNTWVDREGQTRYHETVDDDGALIFTPDYEKVTEIGTPVNADNMNHIEDGIADHENRITVLENSEGEDYVKKSGDTMTGNLVILREQGGVAIVSPSLDTTTIPSENHISAFRLTDKNTKILGDCRFERYADGTQSSRLLVRSSASGSEVNGSIAVAINKDGFVFTEAPTPATGDNSSKIATTAWVNNNKSTIASWSFPDWSKKVNQAVNTTHTATSNGWIIASGNTSQAAIGLKIDGVYVGYAEAAGSNDSGGFACLVPINKGQTYISTGNVLAFIPCYA
jgi:hypothetical protein